jgi:putative Mg2+ transporter-C (MgtC) family protein
MPVGLKKKSFFKCAFKIKQMVDWQEILIRLFLASLFGALIGLERERKDWTAGMRTHMMVCLGSALIMLVSSFGFSDVLGTSNVVLDPSRVAAQVISGIGFIGTGTILFLRQGRIRGLTTASGLWTVAAIGLATGGGMYFAAALTTILALIILWALQPLENRINQRFKQKTLRIEINPGTDPNEILNKIGDLDFINFSNFSIDKSDDGFIIQLRFEKIDPEKLKSLTKQFQNDPSIKKIFWSK